MDSRARSLVAALLTASLLAGCGLGSADMTCKEYRKLGTGSEPVAKQTEVVKEHINTDVPEPKLEIELAHSAVVYWCNERDADDFYTHDDDNVGDYLDDWK